MIVRTARDNLEAGIRKLVSQGLCVRNYLSLVILETGLQSLFEAHRLGRYHVHERTALNRREHCPIQLFLKLRAAHHHSCSRPAQSLVGGCCYEVHMRNRARVKTNGNQSCYVGDISHGKGADIACDLSNALEVDRSRIRRGAATDDLRSGLVRQTLELIIINRLALLSNPIWTVLVAAPREVQWMPVRKVAAVREVHSKNRVPITEHRQIDGHISLGACMWSD